MSDDQRAAVQQVFDGAADTYDAVGVSMFQPIAEQLVTDLSPRSGERALDVGCGRGAVLFRLADAVGPTGRAIGIDLSPRMVEATAAEAAAAGLPAEVAVGDAEAPDVPDAAFELVTSSLVLFFLPDPAAALVAWHRKLVDGGRLGVSTFGPLSDSWYDVDATFAPYLPPGMADPRTRQADTPFGSDEGMERLVADAGFNDVRTVLTTVPVRFDDEEQWYRWTWSTGQRRMWAAVPEADRLAVRAAAEERLQATRGSDGRIGFDQVARFTYGRR